MSVDQMRRYLIEHRKEIGVSLDTILGMSGSEVISLYNLCELNDYGGIYD